ncbi:MAG: ThiF family adenylyltransferase, partial [Coriobacteriia bacterium]|nr:ThiF family adenylyltransferase [Coriobacteriia bacterium]
MATNTESDTPAGPNVREALSAARVGIIGLGGLGAHVSWMLLRTGVRHLVLADYDRVDSANLS